MMTPSEAGVPTEKTVGTVVLRAAVGAIATSTVPGLSGPAARPDAVPERTIAAARLAAASVAGKHH